MAKSSKESRRMEVVAKARLGRWIVVRPWMWKLTCSASVMDGPTMGMGQRARQGSAGRGSRGAAWSAG